MIELYLSSDGKHTVHVAAETTAQMDTLAPYAKALYADVLKQYGTKPQLWEAAKNGQAAARSNGAGATGMRATAPQCPKHHTPMRYRQGRYGDFWSCPTKLTDGTWCTYTVPVPQTGNGHVAPSVSA
jgi:hypothetical protein